VAGIEPATPACKDGNENLSYKPRPAVSCVMSIKFRDGRAVPLAYEPAIPTLGCLDGLTHLPGS